METQILTEVVARIEEERAAEVTAAFDSMLAGPFPDGLLRTELLSGPGDEWRIQTLWRDQAALDAMRSTGETPGALRFFMDLGAVPALFVHSVARCHVT